jgi:ArsR family transcriptional regulator
MSHQVRGTRHKGKMGNRSSTLRPDKDTWGELKSLRDYFRALSDVIRLEILRQLANTDELSVSQLADVLHLSQPLVSWHLSRLKRVGLIKVQRKGRQSHYSLVWQQIRQCQQEFARLIGEPSSRQEPSGATSRRQPGVLPPLTGDLDEGEAWA